MKDKILAAAITLAEKHGYNNIRRNAIATEAGCANGLVNHYWETLPQLQRAVMRRAVKDENLTIIGQGLSLKDKQALKATDEVKKKAFATMMG